MDEIEHQLVVGLLLSGSLEEVLIAVELFVRLELVQEHTQSLEYPEIFALHLEKSTVHLILPLLLWKGYRLETSVINPDFNPYLLRDDLPHLSQKNIQSFPKLQLPTT